MQKAEREMVNGSFNGKSLLPRGGEIKKIDNLQSNINTFSFYLKHASNNLVVAQEVHLKNLRSEYLGLTQKFTNVLVGLSLRLKQYEDQKRVEVVREYIKKLNVWLKQHRRNVLQEK